MSKKILIVDDSATVRQQVGLALSQAGFKVLEAVDGIDGKEQIEANGDLALVVCDVNMPRMNGLDMVAAVKAGAKRESLPILMLTTEGDPSLIARAKKAGAKGWIVKPFNADLLVNAAKKLTAA
jgi:two-component system chemotaxis response regulator CheY